MQPSSINYTNQNQGYFVFIHEDNSPIENTPEWSENAGADALEWDEETMDHVYPVVEDTWSTLYRWYAQMLEEYNGIDENSDNIKEVIKHVDTHQRGAAHYAAEQGHAGVIRLLLQTECKLDSGDAYGFTPLHLAARSGKMGAVKVLLEAKVDPNRCTLNSETMTALHIAAAQGFPDVMDLLLSAGAFVEPRDGDERTPLQLAAERGKLDAVNKLLEFGSNCNVEDVIGHTPMYHAVWNGSPGLVKTLLSAGARVPPHFNLMHHAVMNEYEEIVKLFLNCGISINTRDENGDTPLILAIRTRSPSLTRLLLENGAAVDFQNSLSGCTALHEAVDCTRNFDTFKEIFKSLQDYNVNMNALCFSGCGDTPLFRAILMEKDQIALHLIKHGADVNLCSLTHCHMDNLSLAMSRRNYGIAELLVLAGVKPPLAWKQGPRPLLEQTRIVIRNSLPSNKLYNSIQDLPLPKILKRFLMFNCED